MKRDNQPYFLIEGELSKNMKKIKFKTIRSKILFSFFLVIFFVIIFSAYNLYAINSANKSTKQIINTELKLLAMDQKIASDFTVGVAASRGYLMTEDDKHKGIFEDYMDDAEKKQESIGKLNPSNKHEQLNEKAKTWRTIVEEDVFSQYEAGHMDVAKKNLIDNTELGTEVRLEYEKLANDRQQKIEQMGQQMIKNNGKTFLFSLIISIIVVILSYIIATGISKRITKPIQRIGDRMKEMEEGNISQEALVIDTHDEVGQLTKATNVMKDKIHNILTSIQEVSEQVASSSEELAQSSDEVKIGADQIADTMQELAEGTEKQASNSQELASIMNNFSTDVSEMNEKGSKMSNYSTQVAKLTQKGSQLMNESKVQMKAIDQIVSEAVGKVETLSVQSKEISKLVLVINEIADQTNLLALNAAIEAARAGEHGKGFAVVADEVRKLAEQVTFSVKDISEIVNKIQNETEQVTTSLQVGYDEVSKGTNQINLTGETFDHIDTAINSMNGTINDVVTTLNSFTDKTIKINTAIDDIASVSQESAAGVEETTATVEQTASSMQELTNNSDELAKLAEKLNQQVKLFNL